MVDDVLVGGVIQGDVYSRGVLDCVLDSRLLVCFTTCHIFLLSWGLSPPVAYADNTGHIEYLPSGKIVSAFLYSEIALLILHFFVSLPSVIVIVVAVRATTV